VLTDGQDFVSDLVRSAREMNQPVINQHRLDIATKSTKNFLDRMKLLLETFLNYIGKQIPVRTGFECGFVSGGLFALEPSASSPRKQIIYQHWLKESMTLILQSDSDNRLDTTTAEPPIVIDFDSRSSQVSDYNPLIRLKKRDFNHPLVVYSVIESNFNYWPEHTTVQFACNTQSNLVGSILDMLALAVASNDWLMLQQIPRLVGDEIELLFQSQYSMIGSDPVGFLQNYLFGSMTAEEHTDKVQVELLKPTAPDSTLRFIVSDLERGNQICLNLIPKSTDSMAISELSSDFSSNLGVRYFQRMGDLIVCNIFQTNPDSSHQSSFYHLILNNHVNIGKISEKVLVYQNYQKILVPKINLVHEIGKTLQQRNFNYFLVYLHTVVTTFETTILGGVNLPAMFSGLVRYATNRIHVADHTNTIIFTVQVKPDVDTETHVTVYVETKDKLDGPRLRMDDTLSGDQHKKLRLQFETQGVGNARRVVRYLAQFDDFGPETPTSATLGLDCQ